MTAYSYKIAQTSSERLTTLAHIFSILQKENSTRILYSSTQWNSIPHKNRDTKQTPSVNILLCRRILNISRGKRTLWHFICRRRSSEQVQLLATDSHDTCLAHGSLRHWVKNRVSVHVYCSLYLLPSSQRPTCSTTVQQICYSTTTGAVVPYNLE